MIFTKNGITYRVGDFVLYEVLGRLSIDGRTAVEWYKPLGAFVTPSDSPLAALPRPWVPRELGLIA